MPQRRIDELRHLVAEVGTRQAEYHRFFPDFADRVVVAVGEFLGRGLGFTGIAALVEATLDAAARRGLTREPGNVEEALGVDHDSRLLAAELLPEIAAKAS